jgi:hypothetical protein
VDNATELDRIMNLDAWLIWRGRGQLTALIFQRFNVCIDVLVMLEEMMKLEISVFG